MMSDADLLGVASNSYMASVLQYLLLLLPTIVMMIGSNNNNDNSDNDDNPDFPAHDEPGMCRTRFYFIFNYYTY